MEPVSVSVLLQDRGTAWRPDLDRRQSCRRQRVSIPFFPSRVTHATPRKTGTDSSATLSRARERGKNLPRELSMFPKGPAKQHKKLNRFLRYQVTRANNCSRARKALEDFQAKRAAETIKQERHEVLY